MTLAIQQATPGAKGVDCITFMTPLTAARLKASGIDFVVRYLGALTVSERDAILGAGLALLAVGYSRKPGWSPTGALGAQDGAAAVQHAHAAGLPVGMSLYCDLEGPGAHVTASDCAAYVNAWTAVVKAAGYVAGLYLGYGVPMTPEQLYELDVTAYWHSCSHTPDVATRGFQMFQDPHANQIVAGIQVDIDVIRADKLGGLPMWLVDDQVSALAHAAIQQAADTLQLDTRDPPPDAAV